MDAFLAPLSLIFSHSATALLLQIMNRLTQKSIHSGFTFVIKQPLKRMSIEYKDPGAVMSPDFFVIKVYCASFQERFCLI